MEGKRRGGGGIATKMVKRAVRFSLVLLFHFNGTTGSARHVNALARARARVRKRAARG